MGKLVLKVITPTSAAGPIECDSLRFNVCDDPNGRGGGSCGIRPGHIKALAALQEGRLEAFYEGRRLFAAHCGDGFASVADDVVTVITDKCIEE